MVFYQNPNTSYAPISKEMTVEITIASGVVFLILVGIVVCARNGIRERKREIDAEQGRGAEREHTGGDGRGGVMVLR